MTTKRCNKCGSECTLQRYGVNVDWVCPKCGLPGPEMVPTGRKDIYEALVKDANKNLKETIKEALAELGIMGDPKTLQVKCRYMDCIHNYGMWCRKDDALLFIDEERICRSYKKW